MPLPVSIPPRGIPTANHRARYVSTLRRYAPRARAAAASRASRDTVHLRALNEDMAMLTNSIRFADQANKRVSCIDSIRIRARVTRATGAIHFTGSYAGEANARPFLTPNGPIAVPHSDRRATERLASRNYKRSEQMDYGYCVWRPIARTGMFPAMPIA